MKKGFILITIVLTGSFSAYAQTSSEAGDNFHQIIKQKFMEGGPEFMGIVLLCLILVSNTNSDNSSFDARINTYKQEDNWSGKLSNIWNKGNFN